MSSDPEDPWLLALGAAVSDGRAVDWETAAREAPGAEGRRLVDRLREVASLAAAHSVPEAVETGRWRHLVLYEKIGTGAFGTVYRGWDPHLDREVAVKLLSRARGDLASPLDEARHLARVRHANVVTVHGADEDGDGAGLWMEYIRGRTLAELIDAGGPMSAREATGVGLDLSHALSALHGAGLLHRDIKAQNVMREVGGRIVLMDFSGAHGAAVEGEARRFSGTPLFMAPELFTGGEATPASDIYSLGVLMFFLLTGTLPVTGTTVDDVKAAHARGARTRLRDLRPDVPDAIVQVVERMMAGEAAARFQTAGEVGEALLAATGVPRQPLAVPARLRWWPAAVLVIVAGSAAAAALWARPSAVAEPVIHFTVGPPYLSGSWPRLSPQGTIAFGATVERRNRFWIRPLDAVDGRALMSTTANETPFWSPDGRSLAFFEDGKLKRIDVGGGEPQVVTDAPSPHGGDWSGNCILFATESGIQRVAPDGSQLGRVTLLDPSQGDSQHGWPEFLPDGARFLYVIRSSKPERRGLYLGSLDGATSVRLMDAYSRAALSMGHLLFVRDGTLQAVPFDPVRGTTDGPPAAIVSNVKYHPRSDAAFDATPGGVLAYTGEPGMASTRLVLYDRRGRELRVLTSPGTYRQPRFSPDGNRIVAEKGAGLDETHTDLWIYDLARGGESTLTPFADASVNPAWSPDGKRIGFSARRNGRFEIVSRIVDATVPPVTLAALDGDTLLEDWSRDGRYLSAALRGSGLWVVPLDGRARPWRVRAAGRSQMWHSEFSPDARWLTYMSEESGRPEVYVEPNPATGSRWQISTRGGREPHWRADGRELFYLAADDTIVSIDASHRDWAHAGPQPLFHVLAADIGGKPDYSVSPDGHQVLVNVFVADPRVPPIDVIVNWTALLKR